MNFATIKFYDISNGPGVRTSLYVSGCTHHCRNCFNPMTWDFAYGESFTRATEDRLLESCTPGYISGITLLGGEPMEPENQRALLPFLRRFREACPGKTVWCYSGYTYEELTGACETRCRCEATDALLSLLDVLVDGEFVQALYDISLRFRGSSNQRLIDMHLSLAQGQVVPWSDDPLFASHALRD